MTKEYTLLVSMDDELSNDKAPLVKKEFVDEYHSLVERLETETRTSLGEYKVPPERIRSSDSYNSQTEEIYSRDWGYDRMDVAYRLKALLLLFQITENGKNIGFNTENPE